MTKNKGLVFLRVVIILIAAAIVYGSTIDGMYSSAAAKVLDTIYLPVIVNNYSGGVLPPGNSVVHGIVKDIRTDVLIDNATVCLENTSLCDTTEVDGTYELQGVPTGGYTFIATVASSYDPVTKDLIIQSGQIYQLNFDLFPWLDDSELRVVVTWDPTPYWGDKPNDLNLHMWVRTKDDYRVDIENTGDCETLDDAFPNNACYESDAQLGSGPDAIVLRNFKNDNYTFAVLNYYYGTSPDVPSISSLSARVQVYGVSGLLGDFYVPAVGEGDLWYVFDLDYDGVIVTRNCITQFDQSGDVPPVCP